MVYYWTLPTQAAGAALAMLLVAALTRRGVGRAPLGLGVAAVVAVLFAMAALTSTGDTANGITDIRRTASVGDERAAREKCLTDGGNAGQIRFVRAVRRLTSARAVYAPLGNPIDLGCLAFNLLPRRPARDGDRPDVLIVWGEPSPEQRRAARDVRRLGKSQYLVTLR
jgi:hypothetical protein